MTRARSFAHAVLAGACAAAFAAPAFAASVTVPMAMATDKGAGPSVGSVALSDSPNGVVLTLDLHGLAQGQHGFHLHEKPSCAPSTAADGKVTPAGAAGPHLDPAKTNTHQGPNGKGHLGDLPRIEVGADGIAKGKLTAPRFKSVAELKGHALMIHAGGDTYSDTPTLGGGGARLACGVVP
jgi:Cu-Zn family superoxide dismutase